MRVRSTAASPETDSIKDSIKLLAGCLPAEAQVGARRAGGGGQLLLNLALSLSKLFVSVSLLSLL